MKCVIYKATNILNKKSYIGFATNFKRRKNIHKNRSKSYSGKLYTAIRKYGWENFTWDIIYQSNDIDFCKNIMENYFIRYYNSFNEGYNLTLGGDGSIGVKSPFKGLKGKSHSEETKIKISEQHKHNQINVGSKNGMFQKIPWNKGLKMGRFSEERRRQIGNSHRGRKRPIETGSKISQSKLGRKRIYREDGTHFYEVVK